MGWRRKNRHRYWNSAWYYCGVFVTLILLANVFLLQRNFSGFEGDNSENFIDAGGTNDKFEFFNRDSYSDLGREFGALGSKGQYNVFESRLRKLLEIMENNLDNSVSYGSTEKVISIGKYFPDRLLDCDDIEQITNRTYLASGWTKAVYKGIYKGTPVAMKTVDPQGQDVSTCEESGSSATECYIKAAKKIVKEIVLLQALANDNVLKVLGFCLPRSADDNLWVAMVTELGESVDLIKLLQMSWEDRLRVSYDITKIVDFMHNTQYGSMSMNDFRRQQFVLVDGQLKLSDVDDAGFDDPKCNNDEDCTVNFSSFNFTQSAHCHNSKCIEYNEKRNLFNAGSHFTTFLLPHGAPVLLRPLINEVIAGYSNLTMNSRQLLEAMNKIVNLYKSGWYMNRTKPEDFQTNYKKVVKSDLPGQFDYRCRFSLAGVGCTISVHDQKEAEEVCDLDPQCKGFVMSQQRTWTGRILVHLKSGTGMPSHNPSTDLFIRPS